MAGQDLFEERRSGARQADDENGSAAAAPDPARSWKNCRENSALICARVPMFRRRRICYWHGAARCRAHNVRTESAPAGILVRFAQRKVEMQAVILRQLRALDLGAHGGNFSPQNRKVFRFARLQ